VGHGVDRNETADGSGAAVTPVQVNLVTAKGDLIAGTANAAVDNLAVGANETRLVADSAQATGLKYVADTVDYVMAAKGDLRAGTAADTAAALTVGANETRLVADSAQATGLKYVADTTNYAIAAAGDLLVGSAADTLAPLTIGTVGRVLRSTGTTAEWGSALVSGTEQATTSGTSIDFTSIPSWVKWIKLQFIGVSVSGTSEIVVQIGDAGDVETSGYTGAHVALISATAISGNQHGNFFYVADTNSAGAAVDGAVTLTLEDAAGFTWTEEGNLSQTAAIGVHVSSGSKSLSAALDRVRITTANGTDTFDAGAINILYG
jgi:hypothetical protein